MKRSAELSPLSHDHHVALAHALRLRRASDEDAEAVIARFRAFLEDDGIWHFAQEEALLAPVVPAEHAGLAARMCDEHVEILRRAERLADAESARGLGELLSGHVRFEERELFPLLEAQLPAQLLVELGRELDRPRPERPRGAAAAVRSVREGPAGARAPDGSRAAGPPAGPRRA